MKTERRQCVSTEPRARGPRGSRQKLHLRWDLGPGAPSQSQVSPEGLKEEAHLLTSTTVLSWDFPGSPVVKICTPSAEGMGSVPGRGLRSHRAKKKKRNAPFLPHENLLTGQGTALPRSPQVPGPEVDPFCVSCRLVKCEWLLGLSDGARGLCRGMV